MSRVIKGSRASLYTSTRLFSARKRKQASENKVIRADTGVRIMSHRQSDKEKVTAELRDDAFLINYRAKSLIGSSTKFSHVETSSHTSA